MLGGVLNFASSWFHTTASTRESAWPPYSFGQVSTAQPSSNFFACHALAAAMMSASSRSLSSSAPASSGRFASAFFSSHARAFFRNAASCGVSSKSITRPLDASVGFGWVALASGGVLLLEPRDQLLAPLGGGAEHGARPARAPVEEVAVVLPGEADAAVHLYHLLAGEVKGVRGRDARRRGGGRELRRVVRERPGPVVGVRARELDRRVELRHAVLQRLERRDRAAERPAVHRDVARDVERALRAADLLEGHDG